MIWLDSISALEYYTAPTGKPCYCAILYHARDLILQGSFYAGSGNYTLIIETLTVDGITTLENSTTSFQSYFFVNPLTNQHVFNARLKSFTAVMCTQACYILRVRVVDDTTTNVLFDKYTERYCQASCCDVTGDITFSQANMVPTPIIVTETYAVQPNLTAIEQPTVAAPNFKVNECGERLITLEAIYSCMDMDGNYYQIPSETISGDPVFGYKKIVNMRGKLAKRPRSIERTYSFNCRLQKVESQRVYLLEGYEYFPAWAADEIETMLAANFILVDDVQFEYNSGTPFTMASECKDVFRLQTMLSDCIQRKVFGCDPGCRSTNFDGAQKMFVVPENYSGTGYFYDENKALIAQNYSELLDYYRNLDGVYDLQEIATSPLACETFGAFSVFSYGYVPNSFYFDFPVNGNRVFGTQLGSAEEICPTFGTLCAKPVITFYFVEAVVCAAPVINNYYVAADGSDVVIVTGHGNWSDNGTSGGTVEQGVVTLDINVGNGMYVITSPYNPAIIAGEIIAVVSQNAWPDMPVILNSNNSPALEGTDFVVGIYQNGFVRFFGDSTTINEFQANVVLTGLSYNVNQSIEQ